MTRAPLAECSDPEGYVVTIYGTYMYIICTFLGIEAGIGVGVIPVMLWLSERVFFTISGMWTPSTRLITLPPCTIITRYEGYIIKRCFRYTRKVKVS